MSFKICTGFECLLKEIKSSDKNNGSYAERYQDHIPCSFAYKVVCAVNKFSKGVVLYSGKNAVNKFIETILKEYDYCKKIIKKHFNKNLVISAEEEKRFQLVHISWICDKLVDVKNDQVRNHCHIVGKYRGAAHWICNINLKLTKKVPVIFHNLRGYDSHLIIKKISKLDVKVSVIPNELEKCIAFTINRKLVFIDSMQFMNSSLDSLVKNLPDNDFQS